MNKARTCQGNNTQWYKQTVKHHVDILYTYNYIYICIILNELFHSVQHFQIPHSLSNLPTTYTFFCQKSTHKSVAAPENPSASNRLSPSNVSWSSWGTDDWRSIAWLGWIDMPLLWKSDYLLIGFWNNPKNSTKKMIISRVCYMCWRASGCDFLFAFGVDFGWGLPFALHFFFTIFCIKNIIHWSTRVFFGPLVWSVVFLFRSLFAWVIWSGGWADSGRSKEQK